jgi:hypothetical protein
MFGLVVEMCIGRPMNQEGHHGQTTGRCNDLRLD